MVHNEPMELQDWLNNLPGSPTVSQAADHAEVSKATFLRHAKKGETTAEYVVTISRSYNVNEVDSLVELGFISADAVAEIGIARALHKATNEQLLDEILRRSDPEARYLFGEDDDTIGLADGADVFELSTGHVGAGSYDGTVREWDSSVPHAADSSPDEQAEREKRGEDPID